MQISIIVTTFEQEEQAQEMASKLIELKLAACVQLKRLQSHYNWQGEYCCSNEFELSAKTLPHLQESVQNYLQQNHPYELPQIISSRAECSQQYFDWLEQSLA